MCLVGGLRPPPWLEKRARECASMFKKGFLLKKKKDTAERGEDAALEAPEGPRGTSNNANGESDETAMETNETSAEKPQILVIGDAGRHKHQLVEAVHALSGTDTEFASGHSTPLSLKTKYYTADVHVVVEQHETETPIVEESTANSGSGDGDHSLSDAARDHLVEASVLVVSGQSRSSFRAVTRRWEEFHQGGDRFPKLDIQLLAVLAEGGDGGVEAALLDEVYAWAATSFFECIICDVSDLKKGSQGRDRESFGRVVQALEAHMWSNLQMLPRGGSAHASSNTTTSMTPKAAAEEAKKSPSPYGTIAGGEQSSLAASDSLQSHQDLEKRLAQHPSAEDAPPSASMPAPDQLPAPGLSPEGSADNEAHNRLREFMGDELLKTGTEMFGDEDMFAKLIDKVRYCFHWFRY